MFIQNSTIPFHYKPNFLLNLIRFITYLFPVRKGEFLKFFSITALMFCILGTQNLSRAMKDGVVNTMVGTETIYFLKFWGVLPASFLVTLIYVKLVTRIRGENIFYLIISVFIGFFVLFGFVLFPNHEYLHLDKDVALNLTLTYPHLKWFILLLSNWSFSVFYIFADLWSNVAFALLFWQFVNNSTTVEESKRFYPLFGLFGQTALYIFGQFLVNLSSMNRYCAEMFNLTINHDAISLQIVMFAVGILGILAMLFFWILNNKIIDRRLTFQATKTASVRESLAMVIKSRYIRLITLILIGYGITINLAEGPWKSRARMIYTNPTDFAEFVGGYLSYTGIVTLIFVIACSLIVRRFGWLSAAIITPIIIFVTGFTFFCFINFESIAIFAMTSFSLQSPLVLMVILGAIQNIFSKSSKYTFFDTTKEMSYVPIDRELKIKGKAAADMVGIKIGKSIGALLQSLIFVIIPTASYESTSVSYLLMCVFVVICIIWIWATCELNKEYKAACTSDSNKRT